MLKKKVSVWHGLLNTTPTSNREHVLTTMALFLLAAGLALGAFFIERMNDHNHTQALQHSVEDQLAVLRSRLEANLIGDMQLVKGLIAVIAADPKLDQARFAHAAKMLFDAHTRLKNITAAPDMVIRMIYPLADNALALGLDYRTRPDQWPAVELARRTRLTVLNGPIQLVQGGCGLIVRIPVYLDNSAAADGFWGLVSAVIQCEQLYRDSGLLDDTLELELALRGHNGGGAQGEVFFGRAVVFEANPLVAEFPLPYGSWQLAAVPRGGWPQHATSLWPLRLLLLLVAALVLLPFWGLLRALRVAREASAQMATALSLTEATLEATDNGILVVDQQGKIVSFNQRFAEMWRIPDLLLNTKDDQQFLVHVLEQLEYPQQFLEKVQALYAQPDAISHDILNFCDGRVFARLSHPQRIGSEIVGRVWSFLDITEQERNERSVKELTWIVTEELERSERHRRQLKALLTAIPDPIWMKDANGVFLSCNAEFSKMMGAAVADIIGKTDADFFPAEVAAQFRADDQQAAESATPTQCEEWITYVSDGHRALWATVKTAVWSEDSRRLLGVLGIARDITQRQALLAELKQAHQAALAASDAKSCFLASMSHELRTPLNVIIGFAQMLDLGVPSPLPPQQREAIGHILSSGRHLLELINEVLDLARIEAGRLDLHLGSVALKPLIEEVIGLLYPAATARQVSLHCDGEAEELLLHADSSRLKQVLLNLLSNAIKYNHVGGQVKINWVRSGDRAQISITDTGIGIASERYAEVFQPFHRFAAEQSTIEGTGIGLVICKRLIDAMGGQIGFESDIKHGSRFWFELACAANPA